MQFDQTKSLNKDTDTFKKDSCLNEIFLQNDEEEIQNDFYNHNDVLQFEEIFD